MYLIKFPITFWLRRRLIWHHSSAEVTWQKRGLCLQCLSSRNTCWVSCKLCWLRAVNSYQQQIFFPLYQLPRK